MLTPPGKYEAGTMPTAEVITFNESIKFIRIDWYEII